MQPEVRPAAVSASCCLGHHRHCNRPLKQQVVPSRASSRRSGSEMKVKQQNNLAQQTNGGDRCSGDRGQNIFLRSRAERQPQQQQLGGGCCNSFSPLTDSSCNNYSLLAKSKFKCQSHPAQAILSHASSSRTIERKSIENNDHHNHELLISLSATVCLNSPKAATRRPILLLQSYNLTTILLALIVAICASASSSSASSSLGFGIGFELEAPAAFPQPSSNHRQQQQLFFSTTPPKEIETTSANSLGQQRKVSNLSEQASSSSYSQSPSPLKTNETSQWQQQQQHHQTATSPAKASNENQDQAGDSSGGDGNNRSATNNQDAHSNDVAKFIHLAEEQTTAAAATGGAARGPLSTTGFLGEPTSSVLGSGGETSEAPDRDENDEDDNDDESDREQEARLEGRAVKRLRQKRNSADRELEEQQGGVAGRWRRSESSSDGGKTQAGYRRFGREFNLVGSLEREKLLTFWTLFRETYPSLASHLFSLSLAMPNNDECKFVAKLARTSEPIARLLNEADRLVRSKVALLNSVAGASQAAHSSATANDAASASTDEGAPLATAGNYSPLFSSSAHTKSPHSKPAAGWFSRAIANPLYLKLAQHLQSLASQKQRQAATPLLSSSPAANAKLRLQSPLDQAQFMAPPQPDSHSYGRVAHYPHELSQDSTPTRTLDKLRQLSQSQRMTNEIDLLTGQQASGGGATDDPIESNRIIQRPAALSDDGPWNGLSAARGRSGHSSGPSEADLARSRFVYGSVLLRPSQAMSGSQRQHSSSLSTLRQLSGLGRHGSQKATPAPVVEASDLISAQQQRQQQGERYLQPETTTSESYGRILVSPPSSSSGSSSSGISLGGSNAKPNHHEYSRVEGGQRQQSLVELEALVTTTTATPSSAATTQQQAESAELWGKSSLDKVSQQLDYQQQQEQRQQEHQFSELAQTSSNKGGGDGDSEGENNSGAVGSFDELTSQQYGNSMAAHTQTSSGSGGNEFEGTWHSGPLQQAEVRQLRSLANTDEALNAFDDVSQQQQRHLIERTSPSSSMDLFLVD